MAYSLDDTIVAIASPPGGAARAVLRLSGDRVVQCVRQCFVDASSGSPLELGSGLTACSALLLLEVGRRLPGDLYLWPDGRSYTGQPVAEFHTLGSPPLADAALQALCRAGARLAEPGEFTLRAFLAGRMDLTQAEAVLGAIEADSPADLDVALRQLAGGLATPLRRLRENLLDLLSHLEAGFDFPDEDLPFLTIEQLSGRLSAAAEEVQQIGRQMETRAVSTAAARVVLVGRPNSGKSSLFNALVGSDAALVSDLPGTTRDYLVARLDLDGASCLLIDTAGVEASDGIPPTKEPLAAPAAVGEHNADAKLDEAAQRTTAWQSQLAHLCIVCVDCTTPPEDRQSARVAAGDGPGLVVLTKIDAADPMPSSRDLATSSVTGEGIPRLRAAIRDALLQSPSRWHAVAGTAARCRESVIAAAECLERARKLVQAGLGEELVAIELRAALEELGRVVGAIYTEDVLQRVFSRFCVGK